MIDAFMPAVKRLTKQVWPPPLQSGDRLTRAEFERLYSARPDIKKAELIEGVVYVASPVRLKFHGLPHGRIMGLLFVYQTTTPGLAIADNVTLRLDVDNEVQPDSVMWILRDYGGRAWVTEDDYLAGAPELVVEVAASSAAIDLHDKRHVYRRNGIQEHLVLLPYSQEIFWFVLEDEVYKVMEPTEAGVFHSRVFPGLWLDGERFWADDPAGVLATLQQGLQTTAHTEFVKKLQENKQNG